MTLSILLAARAEEADRSGWFSVNFDRYQFGETLSAKGSVGGAWDENSSYKNGSAGVEACQGLKCLRCATSLDEGLVFAATESSGEKAAESTLSFTAYSPAIELNPGESWSPPEIDVDSRAAFLVGLDGAGQPAFYGWTADGWVCLSNAKTPAAFDTWYGGRMRFVPVAGNLEVSYQLALADGSYVTLADADAKTSFACGHPASGLTWNRVFLRGFGSLNSLGSSRRQGQVRLLVQ